MGCAAATNPTSWAITKPLCIQNAQRSEGHQLSLERVPGQ